MANFEVKTLPDYVKENQDLLIKNFALVGSTRKRISIQTGVKGSAALNFMEVDPTFQDGSNCGFSSLGNINLTQRKIETEPIKVNLDICPKTLRGKYAEYLISMNATEDELPFEAYVMEGVTNSLGKGIEVLMWQGDKTAVDDNVKKWADGFLKIAETEAEVIDVTLGEDVYENIFNVYLALPEEVIERGAEIYVSPGNYRKFLAALVNKNFYHYASAEESAPEEFFFPGTDCKVVKTPGLIGVNTILGTFPKNLFYGCDMEGDEEVIDLWWSKDDRLYKLAAEWNSGMQIAFPNMVVLGK